MKFTGAVEDRVNLWPVAYYREPVGSLAWPLISWGDDHLALRPFYSQYKQSGSGDYDEFNFLWPVSQFDTKHRDYRVFPLFWGESYSDKPYFCLFPALWWNREFAGVFPIFWDNDDDDDGGFCVFPLCWAGWEKSGDLWNTIWPLYYYESRERCRESAPRGAKRKASSGRSAGSRASIAATVNSPTIAAYRSTFATTMTSIRCRIRAIAVAGT